MFSLAKTGQVMKFAVRLSTALYALARILYNILIKPAVASKSSTVFSITSKFCFQNRVVTCRSRALVNSVKHSERLVSIR